MKDRRKFKRKYLAFFTRIFDRRTGDLLGNLADLTADGLMMISEKPLPVGQDYDLRIDLPEQVFDKNYLNLQGQIIWRQPDIHPNFWNSGLELKSPAPQDLQIIEQIIQEFGIRDE